MSIYLAVFLWACAVVAVILIAGLVHELTRPATRPAPGRRVDPADLCMVVRCPDEWEHAMHGWRMCRKHYDAARAEQDAS